MENRENVGREMEDRKNGGRETEDRKNGGRRRMTERMVGGDAWPKAS